MGKGKKYHAVAKGRVPAVYTDWYLSTLALLINRRKAKKQIIRFPGGKTKSFNSEEAAKNFVAEYSDQRVRPHQVKVVGKIVPKSSHHSKKGRKIVPTHRAAPSFSTGRIAKLPSRIPVAASPPIPESKAPCKKRRELDDDAVRKKFKLPEETQLIYVDGACQENGKRGARAGIGVYFGPDDPRNISSRLPGYRQTNQRAELFAALKALETIYLQLSAFYNKSVCILSDSKYVVDGLTKWVRTWDERGWRTIAGTAVISQDLYKRAQNMLISLACNKIVVQLKHVPAHRGILGNEAADRLAVKGSRRDKMLESQWNGGFDDEELDNLINDMLAYEDEELDLMIAEMENN